MNVPNIILLGLYFLILIYIYNLNEPEQPKKYLFKNVFSMGQCRIVFKSDQKFTAS